MRPTRGAGAPIFGAPAATLRVGCLRIVIFRSSRFTLPAVDPFNFTSSTNVVDWSAQHLESLSQELCAVLPFHAEQYQAAAEPSLVSAVWQTLQHFLRYVRDGHEPHVLAMQRSLATLWAPAPLQPASLIHLLLGFIELVSQRTRKRHPNPQAVLEGISLLLTSTQGVLTLLIRQELPPQGATKAVTGDLGASLATRLTADQASLSERPEALPAANVQSGAGLFVAHHRQLDQLWALTEPLMSLNKWDGVHRVIGLRAQSGGGRATLINQLLARMHGRSERAPMVLRTRGQRLFNVPRWPIMEWLRQALSVPLGAPDSLERLQRGVQQLAAWQRPRPEDSPQHLDQIIRGLELTSHGAGGADAELSQLLPYLAYLFGLDDSVCAFPSSRVGAGQRRAWVTTIETLARRTQQEGRAPLVLILEDAELADGSTWNLLTHLLRHLSNSAPILVLLTYTPNFTVSSAISHATGFTELSLPPFDLTDLDQLIHGLFRPNRFDAELFSVRLSPQVQSSPLLAYESLSWLAESGMLQRDAEGHWELKGIIATTQGSGDLGQMMAQRLAKLPVGSRYILEMISVVEDASSDFVLQELAARQGMQTQELNDHLNLLERAGLIVRDHTPAGQGVRCRHPLVRDEIYAQIDTNLRQRMHTEAGEVFSRPDGATLIWSLSGQHMQRAGLYARSVQAILLAVGRHLSSQSLEAAHDLCMQALGNVEALGDAQARQFRYDVTMLRERIYARTGQLGAQLAELESLVASAQQTPNLEPSRQWRLRLSAMQIAAGKLKEARLGLGEQSLFVPGSDADVRRTLSLAALAWQEGRPEEALDILIHLHNYVTRIPKHLWSRALHLEARFLAGVGETSRAIQSLHQAWTLCHESHDLYGEGLTVRDLGELFWGRGRFMEAKQLLQRAEQLLRQAEASPALAELLLTLGQLHLSLGSFDEAQRYFTRAQRLVDRHTSYPLYAQALIGQSWIWVHRGQPHDVLKQLNPCMSHLKQSWPNQPALAEALLCVGAHQIWNMGDEASLLRGLEYVQTAADYALKLNEVGLHFQALSLRLRALVQLKRLAEAEHGFQAFDQLWQTQIVQQPGLQRLLIEVEYTRALWWAAKGEGARARAAFELARTQLKQQALALDRTEYERGFLSQIHAHRELMKGAVA